MLIIDTADDGEVIRSAEFHVLVDTPFLIIRVKFVKVEVHDFPIQRLTIPGYHVVNYSLVVGSIVFAVPRVCLLGLSRNIEYIIISCFFDIRSQITGISFRVVLFKTCRMQQAGKVS